MSQKGPDIFDVAEYRKSTPLTGVRSWTFTRFVIATEFHRVDWVFLNETVDLGISRRLRRTGGNTQQTNQETPSEVKPLAINTYVDAAGIGTRKSP